MSVHVDNFRHVTVPGSAMRVLLVLLFLLLPAMSFADITKPTDLIYGSYGLIVSPDRSGYGEGVIISSEMYGKHTKLSVGAFYTSYSDSITTKKPVGLSVGGKGEGLFGTFDLDVDVGKVEYTSERQYNIYDFILMGEYNYLRWEWETFGSGSPRDTSDLKLWVGGGGKEELNVNNVLYTLYLDDEIIDTLNNPISDSYSSGIKFFISHSAIYRFSHGHVGVTTAVSIPHYINSFGIILIGISL